MSKRKVLCDEELHVTVTPQTTLCCIRKLRHRGEHAARHYGYDTRGRMTTYLITWTSRKAPA